MTWDQAGIDSYNSQVTMVTKVRKLDTREVLELKMQERFRNVQNQEGMVDDACSEEEKCRKRDERLENAVEAFIDPEFILMMEAV